MPRTERVKDMVARAGYVLAKYRNVVAEETIPRNKGTRCTSIPGLNRLDRNTETNPTLQKTRDNKESKGKKEETYLHPQQRGIPSTNLKGNPTMRRSTIKGKP